MEVTGRKEGGGKEEGSWHARRKHSILREKDKDGVTCNKPALSFQTRDLD